MASEELQQRYPDGKGKKVGTFEVFECQLTTLNQFAQAGILPDVDYGKYKTQKCDALVISRLPDPHAVVIGEHKKPGDLTESNWRDLAKDLLTSKCAPTKAAIGYLTDSIRTYWINGLAGDVVLIQREDEKDMPVSPDYTKGDFCHELEYIIRNYDPAINIVRAEERSNPDHLAREVWQTIWRLRADNPEDCLATFVELFLFKFLDDLALLKHSDTGADVSLTYVLTLPKEKAYAYYWEQVRPYVKKLFPQGPDGYSIINGIVLQPSNRDHNIIFHEIMRKFVRFGTLRNTESDFKRRLYESFLKESKTTSSFGQFLTPRKIVSAIHDMAEVERLTPDKEICDPAAGVGGFVLEQMARDLGAQWTLAGSKMKATHNWHAWEILPKTSILARANALVHCGDCLSDRPARIKSFAKWLNAAFHCWDKTALGSLETMAEGKFDLILTNPPFVVSGSKDYSRIVRSNNKRKRYYSEKASGVEGLFVQFIVKSLKANGEAWVLLPESLFLRTTDRGLRRWIYRNCQLDFMAIYPERTFYNTPKRVVVAHLRKRARPITDAEMAKALDKEQVVLFAVSEIGETRDAKRLPCQSDLPEMIAVYRHVKSRSLELINTQRAVVAKAADLIPQKCMNLRHHWSKEDAVALGLISTTEDPVAARDQVNQLVGSILALSADWKERMEHRPPPATPTRTRTVRLGDPALFTLSIGGRVLKKDIHTIKTGIPLFSANVRKVFGFVHTANAGNLGKGGALWSIDSDFDCRGVSAGEAYSITDHCGQVEIVADGINPHYLARQIKQAGLDQGFNREYRPSLGVIEDLEIDLPIREDGTFDATLMDQWATFGDEVELSKEKFEKILKDAQQGG